MGGGALPLTLPFSVLIDSHRCTRSIVKFGSLLCFFRSQSKSFICSQFKVWQVITLRLLLLENYDHIQAYSICALRIMTISLFLDGYDFILCIYLEKIQGHFPFKAPTKAVQHFVQPSQQCWIMNVALVWPPMLDNIR